MRKRIFILFLTGLAGPLLACGLLGNEDAVETATATVAAPDTPTTEIAAATATGDVVAVAEESTATPAVAENVLAAQASATARSAGATATTIARATSDTGSAAATATAMAPFLAELPVFGVDPTQGHMAWIHPPVTIQASGYLSYTYANKNIADVAQDFVLASDITWNTRFGTAGCGYVLRSDGDQDGNYDQYIALVIRGGAGELFFTIMQDGEVIRNEITDININGLDPSFQWQNDTTNRFAVVARGNTFSFYSNGVHVGDVTPSIAYDRGFVAFVGLNESGTTTCHYENAYLWLIN
jgi:hypothetical protein